MGFLDDEDELDLPKDALQPDNTQMPAISDPSQAPPMNPMVKDYLTSKFDLGNYGDPQRQELMNKAKSYDLGDSLGAALISAGGGNGIEALGNKQRLNQQALENFDKGRAAKVQDYNLGREVTKNEREDRQNADEDRVDSDSSKLAQALAKRMVPGFDSSGLSATQLKAKLPLLEQFFKVNTGQQTHQDAITAHKDAKQTALDEKMTKLKTPFGYAITEKDAEDLKQAGPANDDFNSTIDQLIKIRTEKGGGAIGPDATYAKHLADELVQTYDNMAHHAGMSRAGAANIRKLIPEDPLQFRGPLEALSGRDTTLEALKHLKTQANESFKNSIAARTRGGQGVSQKMADDKDSLKKKKDSDAIAWAQANPDDPRSASILKLNSNMVGGR